MTVEIKVPTLGESVSEATVGKWFKKPGDAIKVDEPIVELETDKVSIEVNAPVSGALGEILFSEGTDVEVGALLGTIDEFKEGEKVPETGGNLDKIPDLDENHERLEESQNSSLIEKENFQGSETQGVVKKAPSPAVRKLLSENQVNANTISGTGRGGRITKGDVISILKEVPKNLGTEPQIKTQNHQEETDQISTKALPGRPENALEERVRLTKLRRIISARLKEAQNTAAMLSTWNEVDMSEAIDLRTKYKESFEKKHGIRLGFMSFFVRAACVALKEWPAVNAEIYGDELIYKNYYNIGVAVGTSQGLVVPVIKNADQLSFSEIENKISDLGQRARDGKLSMDDMTGGTFTISNGGVYGSLNSMPILNVPQSGILGMHKIQKRPIAVGDEVVVKPMMYLALSYDHRIIDGREAVSFLVRLKECIEDLQRIMLEV